MPLKGTLAAAVCTDVTGTKVDVGERDAYTQPVHHSTSQPSSPFGIFTS